MVCKCFLLVGTRHLLEVPEVWCHFLKSLSSISISVFLWELGTHWLEITIFTVSGGTSLSGEAASSKLEGALENVIIKQFFDVTSCCELVTALSFFWILLDVLNA